MIRNVCYKNIHAFDDIHKFLYTSNTENLIGFYFNRILCLFALFYRFSFYFVLHNITFLYFQYLTTI